MDCKPRIKMTLSVILIKLFYLRLEKGYEHDQDVEHRIALSA